MSPPPCRSVRFFTVNSPRLSIFSILRPTYRCPFTEPFHGFKSTFGQSYGFTTDPPAPESTVISRYRPRSPPVATGLLSMDTLPIVTAFRSTSSGHSATLELSLDRSSPSLEMSYCGYFGALIGRRWYTPSFWHTEQTGKFTERQPFTSGTDFRAFHAQGSICCKASNGSCFPSQQIIEWILFVSLIFITRFPKHLAKRLCPLEPGIRWQWWHHFCGFHLITMI